MMVPGVTISGIPASRSHADSGEHCVEGRGELGVPVPDQELQVTSVIVEVHQQVTACWVTHSPSGGQ